MVFAEWRGDVEIIPTGRQYQQQYGGLFSCCRWQNRTVSRILRSNCPLKMLLVWTQIKLTEIEALINTKSS